MGSARGFGGCLLSPTPRGPGADKAHRQDPTPAARGCFRPGPLSRSPPASPSLGSRAHAATSGEAPGPLPAPGSPGRGVHAGRVGRQLTAAQSDRGPLSAPQTPAPRPSAMSRLTSALCPPGSWGGVLEGGGLRQTALSVKATVSWGQVTACQAGTPPACPRNGLTRVHTCTEVGMHAPCNTGACTPLPGAPLPVPIRGWCGRGGDGGAPQAPRGGWNWTRTASPPPVVATPCTLALLLGPQRLGDKWQLGSGATGATAVCETSSRARC